MTEFTGKDLTLKWIYSGGTVSLNGDYRTVNWNPSTAYADITAGADTHVGRLPTLKDATAAVTLVDSAGTAIYAGLQAGIGGTLVIQPEGTAVGKRVITFPCFSDGAQSAYTYNDTTTISVDFTGNGAWTDGVN